MHEPQPIKQSGYVAVMANASFRFLWIGQVFSQLAVSMTIFLLAIRVYEATSSSTAVSILFLMFGIPSIFFGLIAGTVVDHFDKRVILVFCDVARALIVGGFLLFSANLTVIYLLVFLLASITQLYTPAEAPSIPRVIKPSQLVTANSLFAFTYYSSLAIGSIMVGPVSKVTGSLGALVVIIAFFAVAAWHSAHIPKEPKKFSLKNLRLPSAFSVVSGVLSEMRQGLIYVKKSPELLDALTLLTGTQITIALLAALGPAFADRMLHIDVRDVSLLMIGPVVVGLLLGSLWVGNRGYRYGTKKLIQYGVLSAGILLIFIAVTVRLERTQFAYILYAKSLIIVMIEMILFFLLGFANSLLDVPANSILQHEADGDMRGRVYGLLTSAVGGIGMLPVVASGVVADVFGVGHVLFALGIVISAYGLYRMRYNHTHTMC